MTDHKIRWSVPPSGAIKSAFIQAPDNVLIELVEGQAQR
jgi:hypothetical protein